MANLWISQTVLTIFPRKLWANMGVGSNLYTETDGLILKEKMLWALAGSSHVHRFCGLYPQFLSGMNRVNPLKLPGFEAT